MDESWRFDAKKHKIVVTLDEGCGLQKLASLHLQGEGDLDNVKIDTIQLQPGRNDLEQKAVVDADGNLLCGEEKVALWLRKTPGGADQIIENWKLALFPEYSDSWNVKKLYKALRADHGEIYDVEKFLAAKFRQARAGIPEFYKSSPKSLKFPPQYWDEIRIEANITVPCMWGHQSECVMRNAAAAAGFEKIQLLLEPLCAAALDIQLLKEAGCLKYGAVATWHDIGCATNNLATVRVNEPEIPRGPPQLEIVGTPNGDLLGAHRVQDMAWEYLQTSREILENGGMKRTLLNLGRMSKEELSRQFSAEVEIRKKIHPVVDFSITITAMADWQMIPAGVPHIERMVGWLEKWASSLESSTTNYLAAPEQRDVSAIVFTGGGSKNATVQAILKASARKLGIQSFNSPSFLPVAHGGLRQYPQRPAEPLPREGYWYITRSAEFNAEWHADVILHWNHVQEMKFNSSGDYDVVDEERMVPVPVAALVTESKMTKGSWIVHDRLTPIMSRQNGVSTTHNVPMDFYVDADSQSRLSFNVYYSSEMHQDQEPLRDKQGVISPGFATIQMTFADIPSLEAAGFVEEQHGNHYMYQIHGLTRMRCREDQLELEINLFVPGAEPDYIDGEIDMTKLPAVFHSDMKEVWNTQRTLVIPDSEGLKARKVIAMDQPQADQFPAAQGVPTNGQKKPATKKNLAIKKSANKKKAAIKKKPNEAVRRQGGSSGSATKRVPANRRSTPSDDANPWPGSPVSISQGTRDSSGGLRRSERNQYPSAKALAGTESASRINKPLVDSSSRSERMLAQEVLRALAGEMR